MRPGLSSLMKGGACSGARGAGGAREASGPHPKFIGGGGGGGVEWHRGSHCLKQTFRLKVHSGATSEKQGTFISDCHFYL